jgi:hypothetical protein
MRAVQLALEHPFALAALILAVLYAWSVFSRRNQTQQSWGAKQIIRTFSPSAIVFILVLAASAGLKLNLLRVDFGMFYSNALLLRQNPGHLYDPQMQTEFLHAVTGLKDEPHYLPFAYPPFVALLFIPMTVFSFRTAYYAMLVVNIAVLTFTLWWLSSRLKLRQDKLTALLVSASGALPLYAVLILGHLTFVGMLLLSLFATDVLGNKKTRAGLWAGLMLFKPILFPVPLLMLLWKKQWRAITLFLVTAFALLCLSFVLVGWDGLQSNIAMMRLMTNDYLLPRIHSLRGLAFSLGLGPEAWIAAALAVVAALWLSASRAYDQTWVLAGAMLAVMLVPPYLQYHDLAIGLIAIAIALTAVNGVSDRTRNLLFIIVLVPAALVLACPRDKINFPIMPVVLSGLFVYCLWKAFKLNSKAPANSAAVRAP